MQRIAVNSDQIARAKAFAKECVGSNVDMYARRNQRNVAKIEADIAVGKVAEEAISEMLNRDSDGCICTSPDYEIYEKTQKSYAADLKFAVEGECPLLRLIHVKAQAEKQGQQYSVSWVFQKRDKLVKAPTEEDFLALCSVADDLSYVDIKHFIPASVATDKYKPMKLIHLSSKCALYDSDLLGEESISLN